MKKSELGMTINKSNLYTLTYLSHSLIKPNDLTLELRKIESVASKHNQKRGISGILIHCKDRFVQRLEGQQDEIYKLMEIVNKDPRHRKLEILFEGYINQRFYNDWSQMKVVTEGKDIGSLERVLVNLETRRDKELSEQESRFITNFLQHYEPAE